MPRFHRRMRGIALTSIPQFQTHPSFKIRRTYPQNTGHIEKFDGLD
jgi:hypothetical protein